MNIIRKKALLSHLYSKVRRASRGAISLLLILAVTPFLHMSLMLVETVRYQDVIENMIEVQDLSTMSLMANYDDFIQSRFGLLAMSQKEDSTTLFRYYLSQNLMNNDTDSLTGDVTANTGLYDTSELERQICEYGQLSIPVELISDIVDSIGVLDTLKDKMKTGSLDKLTKIGDAASSCGDALSALSTLNDKTKAAIEKFQTYKTDLKNYNDKYTEFNNKALAYVTYVQNNSVNSDTDFSLITEYNNLDTARSEYRSAVNTLKQSISNTKSSIKSAVDALNTFISKAQAVTTAGNKLTSQGEDPTTKLIDEILVYATSLSTGCYDRFSESLADGEISALGSIYNSLNTMNNPASFTGLSITSSDTATTIKSRYYKDISAIPSDFEEKTNEFNEQAATEEPTDSQSVSVTGMLDVFSSFLGINFFADENLNARVSRSASMFNGSGEWYEMSAEATMMRSMISIINDAYKVFTGNFWEKIVAIADFLINFGKLMVSMVTWSVQFLTTLAANIGYLADGNVGGIASLVEVAGYAVYNFPNRMTYTKSTTLSGYNLNDLSTNGAHRVGSTPAWGQSFNTMLQVITEGSTGTDETMFKGAELEYILCGDEEEIVNQLAALFDLYMFRFIVDAISSATNSEVQSMCEGTYIAGIVIFLIILFCEPLIDCIMLVNGVPEYFYKKTIYLTPTGILPLFVDLLKLNSTISGAMSLGGDDGAGSKLQNFVGGEVAWNTIYSDKDTFAGYSMDDFYEESGDGGVELKFKKQGVFKMDYTKHLFVLLTTRVQVPLMLKRMQDIIQMEAITYNNWKGTDIDFTISIDGAGSSTQ